MTEQTTAPEADELAITELVEFDPTRLDGVKSGANGFPFLIMKSVAEKGARDCPKCSKTYDADHAGEKCENCGTMLPARGDDAAKALEAIKAIVRGKVDETQDLEVAREIIALLGKAIGFEAAELAAGNAGEACDISLLSQAVDLVKCWQAREQAVADGRDPGMLMCSVQVPADLEAEVLEFAKSSAAINDLPDSAFAHIEDGGSKDADSKTTPRSKRHFPVHDEKHARLAVQMLSASKFGDQAKSKVMAAAKKFGIKADSDASKSGAVAEGDTAVDTDTQSEVSLTKSDLAEAVTKATEPLQAEIASLRGQVAKVLALPQPGGPVLAVTQAPKKAGPGAEDFTAKAAYFRAKADQVDAPDLADGYRQLALEEDAKAAAAT